MMMVVVVLGSGLLKRAGGHRSPWAAAPRGGHTVAERKEFHTCALLPVFYQLCNVDVFPLLNSCHVILVDLMALT